MSLFKKVFQEVRESVSKVFGDSPVGKVASVIAAPITGGASLLALGGKPTSHDYTAQMQALGGAEERVKNNEDAAAAAKIERRRQALLSQGVLNPASVGRRALVPR